MDTVNHIKLRVERTTAPGVLRALLSAIFFHRTLDALEPTTLDILDTHVAVPLTAPAAVTMTSASPSATALMLSPGRMESGNGAGGIEKEIAAKVDEFTRAFVDTGAESGEVAVVFLQRKNRKGWFAVTEALVPWEEHLITLTFVKRATLNPLPGALLQVLTYCAEHKDNVPPLLGTPDRGNLSHQILVSPPSPSDLFEPSSPPLPSRLTSPPPAPATATTPATATAMAAVPGPRRAFSPSPGPGTPGSTGAMGYLGQAKEGLLAVGAKAAGVSWRGRSAGPR